VTDVTYMTHSFNWWGAVIALKLASPYIKYTFADWLRDIYFEAIMWGKRD
jgi:hypothetical protein